MKSNVMESQPFRRPEAQLPIHLVSMRELADVLYFRRVSRQYVSSHHNPSLTNKGCLPDKVVLFWCS